MRRKEKLRKKNCGRWSDILKVILPAARILISDSAILENISMIVLLLPLTRVGKRI